MKPGQDFDLGQSVKFVGAGLGWQKTRLFGGFPPPNLSLIIIVALLIESKLCVSYSSNLFFRQCVRFLYQQYHHHCCTFAGKGDKRCNKDTLSLNRANLLRFLSETHFWTVLYKSLRSSCFSHTKLPMVYNLTKGFSRRMFCFSFWL